jgi:ABC-type polysaccharide transport system permease subunit
LPDSPPPPQTSVKTAPKLGFWRRRWNYRELYLLLFIPVVYVVIFNYIPMYRVILRNTLATVDNKAFTDVLPYEGTQGVLNETGY